MIADFQHYLLPICSYLLSNAVLSVYLFILIWPLSRIQTKYSSLLRQGLWSIWFIRLILPPETYSDWSVFSILGRYISDFSKIVDTNGIVNSPGSAEIISGNPYILPKEGLSFIEVGVIIVWLSGVLVQSMRYVAQRVRFSFIMMRADTCSAESITGNSVFWKKETGVGRPVSILSSHEFDSAFTIGLFRPKIYIPKFYFEEGQRYVPSVFAHEFMHIKRLDDLWIHVQNVFKIVYWFHPLVWLAQRRLTEVREERIDETILVKGLLSPAIYGSSLLFSLEKRTERKSLNYLFAGFTPESRSMVRRIKMIKGGYKMNTLHPLAFLVILTLISWILLPMSFNNPYSAVSASGQIDEDSLFNSPEREKTTISFENPVPGAEVSSGFGMRRHPIFKVVKHHKGIDLRASDGTPVYAAADGSVTWAKADGNYGLKIVLRHAEGYQTVYAQLSAIEISSGLRVREGELIGRVGSSGMSTGPHLHFEIRHDGKSLDPAQWIEF